MTLDENFLNVANQLNYMTNTHWPVYAETINSEARDGLHANLFTNLCGLQRVQWKLIVTISNICISSNGENNLLHKLNRIITIIWQEHTCMSVPRRSKTNKGRDEIERKPNAILSKANRILSKGIWNGLHLMIPNHINGCLHRGMYSWNLSQ